MSKKNKKKKATPVSEFAKKSIHKTIPKKYYDDDGYMDLDNCYDMTVAELGLQQSKRDQIIAFYLTILGFVIPNVIGLDIPDLAKAAAFLGMYGIGAIFCHVILRYRIYKEVYWIACRVITQLCNIKPVGRNRDVIHTLFYHALKKNIGTIVKYRKNGKRSLLRSFKRQLNSAETLLFETLAIFATLVGGIGAAYIYPSSPVCCIIVIIALLAMLVWMNYKYATRLMELYKCIDTDNPDDLKIPFGKAWMLECYIDDIPLDADGDDIPDNIPN